MYRKSWRETAHWYLCKLCQFSRIAIPSLNVWFTVKIYPCAWKSPLSPVSVVMGTWEIGDIIKIVPYHYTHKLCVTHAIQIVPYHYTINCRVYHMQYKLSTFSFVYRQVYRKYVQLLQRRTFSYWSFVDEEAPVHKGTSNQINIYKSLK